MFINKDSRCRPSGVLRLSAKRKRRRADHLKLYWKRQKEARQQNNDTPSVQRIKDEASQHNGDIPSFQRTKDKATQHNGDIPSFQRTKDKATQHNGNIPSFQRMENEASPSQQNDDTREYNLRRQRKDSVGVPIVQGRRIIDINFFLSELQKLNKHSKSGCNLDNMIITFEEKKGFLSGFHCKCKVCKFKKVFWTEDPGDESINNLNSNIVAGMLNIGCGFWDMKELFTKMKIPAMPGPMFKKEYKKLARNPEAESDGEAVVEEIMVDAYGDDDVGTSDEEMEAQPEDEIIICDVKQEVESVFENGDGSEETVAEKETLVDKQNVADRNEIHSGEVTTRQETGNPVVEGTVRENTAEKDAVLLNTTQDGSFINRSCRTNTVQPAKVSQDSAKLDAFDRRMMSLLGRPEEQKLFRCQDCSTDFLIYECLQMHQMSCCSKRTKIPPSATVTSQATVDTPDSCTQTAIHLLPPWTSTKFLSRLEEVKLTVFDKESALSDALKSAKEVTRIINSQRSAKAQKEHHNRILQEAVTWENALTPLHSLNERLFVSDRKTRALAGVQTALLLEKYLEDSLADAARKQETALETAVRATWKEQLTFGDLLNAIAENENRAVLALVSSQESDHPAVVTEKSSKVTDKCHPDVVMPVTRIVKDGNEGETDVQTRESNSDLTSGPQECLSNKSSDLQLAVDEDATTSLEMNVDQENEGEIGVLLEESNLDLTSCPQEGLPNNDSQLQVTIGAGTLLDVSLEMSVDQENEDQIVGKTEESSLDSTFCPHEGRIPNNGSHLPVIVAIGSAASTEMNADQSLNPI